MKKREKRPLATSNRPQAGSPGEKIMEPAFFRVSPVNIKGLATQRLMIVLVTGGCEYARKTGGGCTVCGFMNHARENITETELVAQLDYVLARNDLTGVKEIDLLTLGSFFNDNEVSESARQKLLERISRLERIQRVSIESRAEYVTAAKLKQARDSLPGMRIDFGIGLESADDYIRNEIVKKGLSKKAFTRTIGIVKAADCDLLVYLLIKPPHLSEKEAIADAIASVRYVFETAAAYEVETRVAFEPVFICENTPLEKLFQKAQYRLVNLWSVVEILKQVHHYGNIFVGLSDENLSKERLPRSCPRCNGALVRAIEDFNRTQDISPLTALNCSCKKDYEHKIHKELI
jgi:radical SAM enzyme (TIGR01210 family)